MTLVGSPALAQQQTPIRASIERAAAAAAAEQPPGGGTSLSSGQKGTSFWIGLALGIAGVTTSTLGLTALRTESTSTGNAPAGTYQSCVAQRDSSPIYATNQCGVLKGKNLKLLWGGVAVSGVGASPHGQGHEHERGAVARLDRAVSSLALLNDLLERRRTMTMSAFARRLIVLALVLSPAAASAQRATTGAITGKIADASGGVLPGVSVSVSSTEVLGQFSAVTDAQGIYRVANLPPATYDVKAELQGFQSVIRKATVRLNGVLDVDFMLSVGSVAETVTVTGEAPIVDPERAGLSVNISNKALTAVPVTTNRQFQDSWLVVPGVAVNPATLSLTGSERRTSMDGADVTDPYGGDIFAVNLNYDAVQEVEVKALGAEAADGSSMVGQFMNIVTKSGGNDVHGSAAFFVIPQSLQREQPLGRGGEPAAGLPARYDARRSDHARQDLVLRVVSPRAARSDVQQRAGARQQPRQPLVPERDGAAQQQSAPVGDVSIRQDQSGERRRPRLGGAGPLDRVDVARSRHERLHDERSRAMQIVNPSAFGTLVKGGPLAAFNYNWVMSSNKVFQFVGSVMVNKPNDYVPNGSQALIPTKIIQSNPTGNILGNLTTIAQEGGFGATTRRTDR